MEILNAFPVDTVYRLARGPLVWLSLMAFVAGILVQARRLLALTVKESRPSLGLWTMPKTGDPKEERAKSMGSVVARIRRSVFGMNPDIAVVSLVFHLLIFTVPLFLFSHNLLLEEALGFALFSFSEGVSDFLTVVCLLCMVYFLFRRLLVTRVRAITTAGDYLLLTLVAAPFLTGFLAYHQVFHYKTMIILHLLSSEFALAVIPFTRFVHMVFFFVVRYRVGSEYCIGYGERRWR